MGWEGETEIIRLFLTLSEDKQKKLLSRLTGFLEPDGREEVEEIRRIFDLREKFRKRR